MSHCYDRTCGDGEGASAHGQSGHLVLHFVTAHRVLPERERRKARGEPDTAQPGMMAIEIADYFAYSAFNDTLPATALGR
jgi:hypothetical protein